MAKLKRREKWLQLENVNNTVNKRQDLIWVIFTVFTAGNLVLATAVFPLNGPKMDHLSALVLPVLASLVSLVWVFGQRASLAALDEDEASLRELQKQLKIPKRVRILIRLAESGQETLTSMLIRWLMGNLPWVFLVVWLSTAIYSGYAYCSGCQ